MAFYDNDASLNQFNDLNDEIRAIQNEVRPIGDMIRSIKEENLETLFLKINKFIEIKIILQRDYPKMPPNSIKISYFSKETLNYRLEETVEDFIRNSTLILNDIIDRCYGKCCVYRIYKKLMGLVDGNKNIMDILSGPNEYRTKDTYTYESKIVEKIAESPVLKLELSILKNNSDFDLSPLDIFDEISESQTTANMKSVVTNWSVQSALAIIAPKSASDLVQKIRGKYDRTYDRWPPHINLIYPFVETLEIEAISKDLSKILAKHEPFNLNLNKMNHFASNCVVYLEPNSRDATALTKLQKDLATFFGQAPNKANNAFKPHMTIAQPEKRKDSDKNWSTKMLKTIGDEFSKSGISAQFTVDSVFWITRNGSDDPFRVKHAFPLGVNRKIDEKTYSQFNY